MLIEVLKSKIHRAIVTETSVEYEGSITIDAALMRLAGIHEFEKVLVAVVDTGKRFTTYAIRGKSNSGTICANGAAAHLVSVGQRVIIMAFAHIEEGKADSHAPQNVRVDDNNAPR